MVKELIEINKRFNKNEKRLSYLEKQYLKDVVKIKKALEKVCGYKSEVKLIEIGRQNLTNDIDNEVMPLINKIINKL